MNKKQFENELLSLTQDQVQKYGYHFSLETQEQLRELISSGVNRMEYSGKTTPQDLDLARRNILELSKKLCENEASRFKIVEQRTFTDARFTICPLWPFC